MVRFFIVCSLLNVSVAAMGEQLEIGAMIPSVAAPNQSGETVNIADDSGTGYTLVFFYPKANTPGCTAQVCSLRDAYADLAEAGVRVFGVSRDSVVSQKAFHGQFKVPFDLLADKDGVIVEAFGNAPDRRFAARQAFLFHEGKLVWRDLTASTKEQASDVLKVVRGDD